MTVAAGFAVLIVVLAPAVGVWAAFLVAVIWFSWVEIRVVKLLRQLHVKGRRHR